VSPTREALHCTRDTRAGGLHPLAVHSRHAGRGPHAAPPAAVRGCTCAWKAFPAEKVGTALAGIWTVSPVRGFRPARG
jgi:hypothetical protein